MKKFFLTLVAAIAFCGSVQAQQADYDNKHELAVSYGAYSNSKYFSFIEDLVTLSITNGSVSDKNEKFIGPISVEYFYRMNQWLSLGGIGAFAVSKKDICMNSTKEKFGTSRGYYMTIMPAAKADWLRRKHFGMYSKLALGVTVLTLKDKVDNDSETGTAATVNWQLSLVGLEAGSSKLRAFAELGIGEQGVALIGLRYKF